MAYCLALSLSYHESSQSWREQLGQLKRLGLSGAPKLIIGNGSLGFWIALQEEYVPITQQRIWVHKTANAYGILGRLCLDSCLENHRRRRRREGRLPTLRNDSKLRLLRSHLLAIPHFRPATIV
jgi:putative transposase